MQTGPYLNIYQAREEIFRRHHFSSTLLKAVFIIYQGTTVVLITFSLGYGFKNSFSETEK